MLFITIWNLFLVAILTTYLLVHFQFSLGVLTVFFFGVFRIAWFFSPKNFGLFGSRSCDNLSSVDDMLPPRELFHTVKNEVFKLSDLSLVTLALASLRTYGKLTSRFCHTYLSYDRPQRIS